MFSKRFSMALAAVATCALASVSQAATITFDEEVAESGTGIGSVLTVLTVQETPEEAGSVSWDGSADVITGDAKTGASQTTTRTVEELLEVGISDDGSNLALVFNIDETGNDDGVTLEDLTATFYDDDGSVLFTASTSSTYDLGINSGIGNSGWLFEVELSDEEAEQFFSDSANRLGLSADVTGSRAGPETFYVAGIGAPTIVPIPAAAWLGLIGIGMAAAARRRYFS